MPSQLPTADTSNRRLKDYGVGTYDSPIQSEYNDEGDFECVNESLPIVRDPRKDGDEIVGDAYSPTSDITKFGAAVLPGDLDTAPRGKKKPEDYIIQAPLETVAHSELPSDKDNPPARSDYYDRTKVGETKLPGAVNNDRCLDRFLGALGNWWSGFTNNDVAQPMSFPVMDRSQEEVDKYTSVPMGISSVKQRGNVMQRQATNLELVGVLASDFLKKYGKQGLTRRHVMAFLREEGYHQYLASDIVRCLQQRHNVSIVDALDQFPVSSSKVASVDTSVIKQLAEIRNEIASINNPVAAKVLSTYGNNIIKDIKAIVDGLEVTWKE